MIFVGAFNSVESGSLEAALDRFVGCGVAWGRDGRYHGYMLPDRQTRHGCRFVLI